LNILIRRLSASGFTLALILPMITIMLTPMTTVVASSNDCEVAPGIGIDWENQANLRSLEDQQFFWDFGSDSGDPLSDLESDLYAEIGVERNGGAALELALVTGYSYTFCVEFNPDPDNPLNGTPKGDVYLLTESNWDMYSNEYSMYIDGWGMTSEDLEWIPVEWRDMAVFLPFRDTHAYENKQSLSFSTALDNDQSGWISWFGESSQPSYYLVFDNWNNSRHSDSKGVEGDMIVQIWVDVENRLTLPKFTAYLIVGILPIACIAIPLLMHSRYHAAGAINQEEENQTVPLLEKTSTSLATDEEELD